MEGRYSAGGMGGRPDSAGHPGLERPDSAGRSGPELGGPCPGSARLGPGPERLGGGKIMPSGMDGMRQNYAGS